MGGSESNLNPTLRNNLSWGVGVDDLNETPSHKVLIADSVSDLPSASDFGNGIVQAGSIVKISDGLSYRKISPDKPTKTNGKAIADFGWCYDKTGTRINNGAVSGYTFWDTGSSQVSNVTAVLDENDGGLVVSATVNANQGRWFGVGITNVVEAWDLSAVQYLSIELGEIVQNNFDLREMTFRILLSDSSDPTALGNYKWSTYFYTGGISKQNKNIIRVPVSLFTDAVGTPALTSVRKIVIRMHTPAPGTGSGFPSLTPVNLSFKVRRIFTDLKQKTQIIFSFDDGAASVYDVPFKIFKRFGWKASIGVVGNKYKSDAARTNSYGVDFMSVNELREIHDYGWDLSNHTWGHRAVSDRHSYVSGTGTTSVVISSKHVNSYNVGDTINIQASPYWELKGIFPIIAKNQTGSNDLDDISTYGEGTLTIQLPSALTQTSFPMGYMFSNPGNWSNQQVVDEILNRNRDWMHSKGLKQGSDIVIYPFGAHGSFIDTTLQANGYRAARSTRTQYRYPAASPTPPNPILSNHCTDALITYDDWVDFYDLPIIPIDAGVGSYDTPAELLAFIDYVNDSNIGGTHHFYGHSFTGTGGSNFTPANAETFFYGVRERELSGECEVIGFSDWLDELQ